MALVLLFFLPFALALYTPHRSALLDIPPGPYVASVSSLPPGASLTGHLQPRPRTTLLEIIRDQQEGNRGRVMLTAKRGSVPEIGGSRFRGAVRFHGAIYSDNEENRESSDDAFAVGIDGLNRMDGESGRRWSRSRSRTELLGRPGVWVDADGYLSGGDYSYLVLPAGRESWYFKVRNDNGSRREMFTGTLRVTEYDREDMACPIGVTDNGNLDACSGRGKCMNGRCVCEESRGGRYCQHEVLELDGNGIRLTIPSEKAVHLKYTVAKTGAVAAVLKTLPTQGHSFVFQQPVMVVRKAREIRRWGFDDEIRLPIFTDFKFWWGFPQQTVTRSLMRRGEVLYLAIYNMHHHSRVGKIGQHYPVDVWLEVYPCGGLAGRRCPIPVHYDSWELNPALLILPFCVVGFAVTIMLMCITVWIRICRAHAFEIAHGYPILSGLSSAPSVDARHIRGDRLSKSEIEEMFPTFPYRKEEFDALGVAGDLSCSVCLSNYEQGERVRRLPCGHVYHDACLDTWLTGSCATCPRCRRPARIETSSNSGFLFRRAARALFSRLYLRLRQYLTMNEPRQHHRDYRSVAQG